MMPFIKISRREIVEEVINKNRQAKKCKINNSTTPTFEQINKQEMFVPNHPTKTGVTLCL